MTDREQIRELIAAYALLLDADDIEGCLGLFTADSEYLVFGKTLLGPEKVRKMFTRAPRGMHLTGASVITTLIGLCSTAVSRLRPFSSERRRAASVCLRSVMS